MQRTRRDYAADFSGSTYINNWCQGVFIPDVLSILNAGLKQKPGRSVLTTLTSDLLLKESGQSCMRLFPQNI